jgi:transmembrane sensor
MARYEDHTTGDPNEQHAVQGAAHWLATLSDESCTDAERQQFSEWLRASTRNVEEFLRLSTLARSLGKRELWPEQTIEQLVEEARASSNVTTLEPRGAAVTDGDRRKLRPWLMAAAVACLLVGGAIVLRTVPLTQVASQEYQTALGEQRSITLEDGSVVELNTRSRLRTRFTRSQRALDLVEGEAIFRVVKDANRPFVVRARETDIVAVGTAFNVNASEARTVVTVLEGRVRVNKQIELAVGEQLIVAPAQPTVRVAVRDTEKVTSWTERRLIFENTPIEAAAAEFARYSARRIRIEDAEIGAREINAVFDATDPGSFVEFLRKDETGTVEVVDSADGWTVRRRE